MKFFNVLVALLLSSLFLTGCFESPKEKMENELTKLTEQYYKEAEEGKVRALLSADKYATPYKDLSTLTTYYRCILKNPHIFKNSSDLISSARINWTSKIKKLDKNFLKELSNGNGNEEYRKILAKYKEKTKKMLTEKESRVLFDKETLFSNSFREFNKYLEMRTGYEYFAIPISKRYPKESKECVLNVLKKRAKLKSIENIVIKEEGNKKTAEVNVILSDISKHVLHYVLENNKWILKRY